MDFCTSTHSAKSQQTLLFPNVRLQPRTCTGYKQKMENSLFGNYSTNQGCYTEASGSRGLRSAKYPLVLVLSGDKTKVLGEERVWVVYRRRLMQDKGFKMSWTDKIGEREKDKSLPTAFYLSH